MNLKEFIAFAPSTLQLLASDPEGRALLAASVETFRPMLAKQRDELTKAEAALARIEAALGEARA